MWGGTTRLDEMWCDMVDSKDNLMICVMHYCLVMCNAVHGSAVKMISSSEGW